MRTFRILLSCVWGRHDWQPLTDPPVRAGSLRRCARCGQEQVLMVYINARKEVWEDFDD